MTISLDEFRGRLRASPQGQGRVAELKALAQDAPRAAALTGREEWDWFNRYIEAQIKQAEAGAKAKKLQVAALVLVDEAKAKAAAVQVTILETRAQTLREIILLPKWLLEQGGRAHKLLAAMEAEE